jgi:hypothetical protein
MKITCFLFASLFLAGLIPGTGLGYSFAQAMQQGPSQGAEKIASGPVAEGQKDTQATDEKNQDSRNTNGKSTNSKSISKTKIKRGLIVRPAKPAPIHRQVQSANGPTANNFPPIPTENAAHFSQTAPNVAAASASAVIPHKTQSYQKTSALASAFSINGERFKNSRQPGARLAINGGPANSTHGTAAINGSDIKRKP